MVERRSSHFEAPHRGKSSGNFRRENHDETTGISDKALYLYIYKYIVYLKSDSGITGSLYIL